ncbi:MAG: glycosyltransferase family 39 protein [Bacteroidota bacterium]
MLNKYWPEAKAIILEHKFFFFLLAFYFFLSTFMLGNYPRVWVDEPWESITASTLAHAGKMYNPVLENYSGFDKVFLQPRLVMDIVLAPAFATFGVGPMQGRLVSAACGALLMVGVYLFTLKFISRRAALLAVWFVMIETMMFISYRTIRPEIYLVTLEVFSLMFFFQGIRTQLSRHFFLSGLLSGIALWTHPNALLFVFALVAVLFLTYKIRAFTSRYSWSFAAAIFIGILPYLVYVIANDAQNSFSTFYLQLDNRTGALAQPHWLLTSLTGEWGRVLEYTRFPSRVAIVIIFICGWGYSLFSKKREVRNTAIVIGVEAFFSFLLITSKTIFYSTSVLPPLCILAAVTTDDLLGEPQAIMVRLKRVVQLHYWRESLAVLLFILLSLNQVLGDANLLWEQRNCSYAETIGLLQSVIPPHARVWGSITFWYGFQHQPFRSQYTYLREMESFKPEYMITGDVEVWGKDFWASVREKANETVTQRGTLIAEFPKNCYGTLRVYRLQW